MFTQQFKAIIGIGRSGAEADGDVAILANFQANGFTCEVGFIANQRHLGWIRTLFQKLRPQCKRVVRFRCSGIHHQQHTVCFTNGLESPLYANFFDLVIRITQPGRIHHMQGHAIDVDMFAQHVPGRSGDLGHDGSFAAGQRIQQAGLTCIGPTGNDHGHAIAQQGTLAGFTQNGG